MDGKKLSQQFGEEPGRGDGAEFPPSSHAPTSRLNFCKGKCGTDKPISEFDVADKKTGRRYNECKDCRKAKRLSKDGNSRAVAQGPKRAARLSSNCKILESSIEPSQQSATEIAKRIIEPKTESTPNPSMEKASMPERIIEPPLPLPEQLIEPSKTTYFPGNSAVDYSIWERGYGRGLSSDEQREIRFRMTEFFKLLMSEDKKGR